MPKLTRKDRADIARLLPTSVLEAQIPKDRKKIARLRDGARRRAVQEALEVDIEEIARRDAADPKTLKRWQVRGYRGRR